MSWYTLIGDINALAADCGYSLLGPLRRVKASQCREEKSAKYSPERTTRKNPTLSLVTFGALWTAYMKPEDHFCGLHILPIPASGAVLQCVKTPYSDRKPAQTLALVRCAQKSLMWCPRAAAQISRKAHVIWAAAEQTPRQSLPIGLLLVA